MQRNGPALDRLNQITFLMIDLIAVCQPYNEMTFVHDYARSAQVEKVIYIEYQDGKVFSVSSASDKGYVSHFDFEPDCKEIEMYMCFHSGSGGTMQELQAPEYTESGNGRCSYWLHPDAAFRNEPKNTTRLEKPIEYEGDANPFNHAREVGQTNYCKICQRYYDDDACDEHHRYDDELGLMVYPDGSLEE